MAAVENEFFIGLHHGSCYLVGEMRKTMDVVTYLKVF